MHAGSGGSGEQSSPPSGPPETSGRVELPGDAPPEAASAFCGGGPSDRPPESTDGPGAETQPPSTVSLQEDTAEIPGGQTRSLPSGAERVLEGSAAEPVGAPEPAEKEVQGGAAAEPVIRSDTFVASVASSAPPAPPAPRAPAVSVVAAPHRRWPWGDRPRHRRSRRLGTRVLAVLAVLLILGGSSVAARATVALPPTDITWTLASSPVAATSHPVSWPSGVQAALTIPALGVSAASGPERPAPIASLTKLMTAHIVLTDHPLTPGDDGPSITITPADVDIYLDDENTDQANIEVAVGEVLSEKQVLEGMLIHSANNFADLLADWDAGSVPAFVAKMNAAARALGMTGTTYADASGFSTQSVSTPADQLKLAAVLVGNPVVDEVVDNTSVTLPVAGTVGSYTPLIGVDGVVGVKSGFTSAAGGCDVLALRAEVHGVSLEVLAAVTGYQGGSDVITGAGIEALAVARQAVGELESVEVVAPRERVGVAQAAGYATPVVAGAGISLLGWPGQRIVEHFVVDRPPPSGAKAGWRVGSLTASIGAQEKTVSVSTSRFLRSPSILQRIF